ncbi:hypothetical protein KAU15_06950 [candidate division WOR-3 bacterium]|nr:hypothetical protein [candidate division WOR-3 bacterium]
MNKMGFVLISLCIILISGCSMPSPSSVEITSPNGGIYVERGATVTITADASDAQGIEKVVFFADYERSTDTSEPYECTFTAEYNADFSPNPSDVNIWAVSYDEKGNEKTSETVVIHVNP